MKRILAARQDNNGDVLLTGPAVRALATDADVIFLSGPRGEPAARMLPAVSGVLVQEAPWIDADPQPADACDIARFIVQIRAFRFDEAAIFTSFHQSPLPLALLLRMAGIPRIGAISVDYPGSLLDVRHRVDENIHEVQRALSLVRAMGYHLPAHDGGRLQMSGLPEAPNFGVRNYVVVHPGATMPARAWYPERNALLVERLCDGGHNVIVTGSALERALTNCVAGTRGVDAGGKTTFAEFSALVRDAAVVICGNTATAHVASAVNTPVVSIFPPTIPAVRFKPWMVDHVLLGDQDAPCGGCRARACPIEGQPCLDGVDVDAVLEAVRTVARVSAEAA